MTNEDSTDAEDDQKLDELVSSIGELRLKRALSRRKTNRGGRQAKKETARPVGRPRKTPPQFLQHMFWEMMCSDPTFEIGVKPYSLSHKIAKIHNLKGDISENIRTIGDNFKYLFENYQEVDNSYSRLTSIRAEISEQRDRLADPNIVDRAAILAKLEASERDLDEAIYKFNLLRKSIYQRTKIVSIEQD